MGNYEIFSVKFNGNNGHTTNLKNVLQIHLLLKLLVVAAQTHVINVMTDPRCYSVLPYSCVFHAWQHITQLHHKFLIKKRTSKLVFISFNKPDHKYHTACCGLDSQQVFSWIRGVISGEDQTYFAGNWISL